MSWNKPHSQASTVAHNWANKYEGQYKKDNTAGTLYYEGDTIYSYGTHFPIAKHIKNKKGENAVLFTTKGYSNTTAKHISVVRSACSHLTVIYCSEVPTRYYDVRHELNYENWVKQIQGIALSLPKAKKPAKYIEQIEQVLSQVKTYQEFFGVKPSTDQKKVFTMPITGFVKMAEKTLKERAQKEAERKEAERVRVETELKEFRSFERDHIYSTGNTAYLRYNKKTKRIETSKQVEIPAEIARRFYKWVKAQILSGGCNGDCEMTILNYKVKAVNTLEFTVGCHTITIAEADQLALKLKWK